MKNLIVWTMGFLSFPIAGIAGSAVAGPVDAPLPALLGGLVTGLVVGTGQVLASRGRLDPWRWIPATAAGMGAGLALGAAAVGYRTSLGDLALMGALTGVPLGIAQGATLGRRALGRRALGRWTLGRWAWAAAMPPLWALGWTVTTLFGVDVEAQYTIFGSTGAITVTVLSGLLLGAISRSATGPAGSPPPPPRRGRGLRASRRCAADAS